MTQENIWKYFKIGDIVKDAEDSVWGDKMFVITNLRGNHYLPLASAYLLGKPKVNSNQCNLLISRIRLISCADRPLKKLNTKMILKLLKNGNVEAKREFIIRNRK